MGNESWSLELLFSKVSAQGEPLALTNHEKKSGVVFWAFWVTFLCFLSGWIGSLGLANASSCLELRFARFLTQEELLAPRSDQNKVFGHFSKRFGSLFFFGWVAWIGLQLGR